MPRLSDAEPFIHADCDISESKFGAFVEIGRGSRVAFSEFRDYAYCDRFADIANATVGKFSNLASYVRIGATDHPLHTATLHHFLYRSPDYWDDAIPDAAFFEHRRSRRAEIGNDTWLGHACMVKPEVTVGHGAVVAAGAIVTRDVGPYEIVAGAPAKRLRLRQPRDIAERLIALAWWDWDHATLRERLDDFRGLKAEAFLERYEA